LKILDENFQTRTVKIEGSAQQMDEAFGIHLCRATDDKGNQYLTYREPLTVPQSIAPYVTAILGLDQRPVARHHAVR